MDTDAGGEDNGSDPSLKQIVQLPAKRTVSENRRSLPAPDSGEHNTVFRRHFHFFKNDKASRPQTGADQQVVQPRLTCQSQRRVNTGAANHLRRDGYSSFRRGDRAFAERVYEYAR